MTTTQQVVSRNEGIGDAAACRCNAPSGIAGRPVRTGTGFRARFRAGSWLGLGAGIALALVPKCPLCLVAYLSVLGVGVGAAKLVTMLLTAVAPTLLPFGVVVASVALASLVRARRHRSRRHPSWENHRITTESESERRRAHHDEA